MLQRSNPFSSVQILIRFIATLLLLIFLCQVHLAREQTDEPASTSEKSVFVPVAIPFAEIPIKVEEAIRELKRISMSIPGDSLIDYQAVAVTAYCDSLDTLLSTPVLIDLPALDSRRLSNLLGEWNAIQERLLSAQGKILSMNADLEDNALRLSRIGQTWSVTADSVRIGDLDRDQFATVDTILGITGRLETRNSTATTEYIRLQSIVSEHVISSGELIASINSAQRAKLINLFVKDSPYLWDIFEDTSDSTYFDQQIRDSWNENIQSNLRFVSSNEDSFYRHLAIFFFLTIFLFILRFRFGKQDIVQVSSGFYFASTSFLRRPLGTSVLISLFLSIWIYSNMPSLVGETLLLLMILPILRLLPVLLKVRTRYILLFLTSMLLLNVTQKLTIEYVLLHRLLLLFETAFLIGVLAWSERPAAKAARAELPPSLRMLLRLLPLALFTLVLSLAANLYGAVGLSTLLTTATADIIYFAIAIWIAMMVLDGIVILLLRNSILSSIHLIAKWRDVLERRLFMLIHLTGLFLWLRGTLNVLKLKDPIEIWLIEALQEKWAFGKLEIALSDVFSFFLILLLTFVIARLVRLLLEDGIFHSLKLPRGVPGAVSMLTRYVIVALGIYVAISSLGIDLSEFGLMAGALGVGLGFGLQNIIANFVSGLILAFERPVQVGDTIEVGPVFGSVTQIGVRSSTVRTFDGSEVIVPNSDLISQQVTNWTLSDKRKRLTIPIRVAYGSNPHTITELLKRIAEEHPETLDVPAPLALFDGYGEHSMDFRLLAWVPTSAALTAPSEIALNVHDALLETGVEFPTPQLIIRSADSTSDKKAGESG